MTLSIIALHGYLVIKIDNFTSYNELPEDTSLQRNIKEYLLSGQIIKIGIGTLK